MSKQIWTVGVCVFFFTTGLAIGAEAVSWQTDFEAAKRQAASENKLIFANFSGSDWCVFCQKLDAEVLGSPVFLSFAKDRFVLLLVDFPMKQKIAGDLKKQNDGLAQKYNVKGFPTILLLNGEGNVVQRTGYRPGGAEKYVEHLRLLLKPAS